MSHTPGPYKVGKDQWDGTEYWTAEDVAGVVICMEPTDFFAYAEGPFIEPAGDAADAEFIARALNAHDDLLAACKAAIEYAPRLGDGRRGRTYVMICDAIAKAEPAEESARDGPCEHEIVADGNVLVLCAKCHRYGRCENGMIRWND